VHEQDMSRQAIDNIHGTPWLMAATIAIITPP
jgi:hypothetical protein